MSAELDQCREEFEAELRSRRFNLHRMADGEYFDPATAGAWIGFRAARRTPQEAAQAPSEDEAFRRFQRERIEEARRHDAEQAKPSLYTSPSCLSTEDDPSHPRFVAGFKAGHAAGRARASTEDRELMELRRLIADDAYAMTFQTFGQYRTALLKGVDAIRTRLSQSPEGRKG